MKNIIFSIEELSKKPMFCIFTIIQLIISFILIFIAISTTNYLNEKSDYMNKVFSDKEYYIINADNSRMLDEVKVDSLTRFEKYIADQKLELYSVRTDSVFLALDNLDENYLTNFDTMNLDNKMFKRAKSVLVNNQYINCIGIELSKGDFKGNNAATFPVILGNNYTNIVKLHDVIPYVYTGEDGKQIVRYFEVCGFAQKDSCICIKGDPGNIINIDDRIILETNLQSDILNNSNDEMVKKINIFNYFSYGYLKVKDVSQIKDLEELSVELGLNYKMESTDSIVKKFNENILSTITQVKAFSMSILLFTVISIVMVMLSMITKNRKEFAINILVGASINDIIIRIFHQVSLLFIFSVSATLLIVNRFIKDDVIIKVNYVNIIELLVFSAILCIAVSIIPIAKFKNNSINSIIRGSE